MIIVIKKLQIQMIRKTLIHQLITTIQAAVMKIIFMIVKTIKKNLNNPNMQQEELGQILINQ